jgi:hypothetical protein
MDVSNRYISTIMLVPGESHVFPSCSGILLNRRVALTAASCVCPPRQAPHGVPEKGPIGPAACAERAFVMTVHMGPPKLPNFPEESVVRRFERVGGQVHVHPSFKLELDDQGAVLSTRADLAIIVLDLPVTVAVPRIPLAETEVQEHEALVMAGYGDDERFRDVPGVRYFRHNKAIRIQGSDGKVLYEQQGPFVYDGYMGGPCFREDESKRWLVGIASVGSEQELSFTSTYFFRNWLRAELQRVSSAASPSVPAPQHPQ